MSTPKTEFKAVEAVADPQDGGVPKVDTAVQGAIGRKLRETYEEVVREEVPERFLELLDELKKKEQDAIKGGT